MADLGACMNGESVLEFACMQIPTLIIDNNGKANSYKKLLYTQYDSDINMVAKGEVITELLGMNFPEKVCEQWILQYENPTLKYKTIRRLKKLLFKFLAQKQNDTILPSKIDQDLNLELFWNPNYLTALKLKEFITKFKSTKTDTLSVKKMNDIRKETFQNIEVI